MDTQTSRPRPSQAAFAVACHAIAPLLWFGVFVFVVPRFAAFLSAIMDEAQGLPLATQWLLNMSQYFIHSWQVYPALFVCFVALDVAVSLRLAASHRQVWSGLILGGETVITLFLIIGACLPLTRIY